MLWCRGGKRSKVLSSKEPISFKHHWHGNSSTVMQMRYTVVCVDFLCTHTTSHLNTGTPSHAYTCTHSHHLTHSQVNAWIQEKLKTACDESYRDPTNLQTKLQKHQAFEAELAANKGRVDGVCTRGSELIAGGNYMSEGVRERVNTLTQDWKKLTTASADKGVWAGVWVCGRVCGCVEGCVGMLVGRIQQVCGGVGGCGYVFI